MKFDLSAPMIGIDGKPVEGPVNQYFAILVKDNRTWADPIKFHSLAERLYKHGFVEIDESDRQLLIKFTEAQVTDVQRGIQGVTAEVRAHILRALNDAKDQGRIAE